MFDRPVGAEVPSLMVVRRRGAASGDVAAAVAFDVSVVNHYFGLLRGPDAARWIAPSSGSMADGQTPGNGRSLPNFGGQQGYFGPCPPAGTGMRHYRFTLYELPAPLKLPSGSAGVQAAEAIAQAATVQARLTGTFQG